MQGQTNSNKHQRGDVGACNTRYAVLTMQGLLYHHCPLNLAIIYACISVDIATAVDLAVCSVKMNGSGSGGGLFHAMLHAGRVCFTLALAVSKDMAKRWTSKRYRQWQQRQQQR
jgi:hypothetical protein